jgi:hypothetical protein
MQESSSMLRNFVAELMEREGAVVERVEPDALEYMAPGSLQQSLGIGEFGRIGFRGDLAAGTERAGFESDWLERLERVVGDRGRVARSVLDPGVPSISSPERVLEHGLTLHNGVYRLNRVSASWTRYLLLAFHYTALSDEKRDGIVWLAFNLSNASALDGMVESLLGFAIGEGAEDRSRSAVGLSLPPMWNGVQINKVVERGLPARIRRSLSGFLKSMQKRLERDLLRLFDYYNNMQQESLLKIRKQAAETAREQLRVEAISREYPVKVTDLEQKYAMKIDVEWIQTLELILPVQRFELTIKRRKGERRFHLDWNTVTRKLEPPPCEYSYGWEGGRMVCDEALHLVSLEAHGACAKCEREYCRACNPVKCPKCGWR